MNSSDDVRTTRFSNPRVAGSIPAAPTSPRKPSQSQHLTPKTGLQQSDCTQKLYLRAAIDHTLAKVESETKPLTKREWADYERLRQLVRMYRQAGRMNWSVLWWAWVTVSLVVIILYWRAPKSYIYTAPTDTWRIISDVTPAADGYEAIMQRVHEGRPLPPWEMHFCSDYKPLFEIGMSLNWFAFEDRGSCVSIARKDLGYVIDRGPDTWPKLARNCQYHINPTVAWGKSSGCDGKPQFD